MVSINKISKSLKYVGKQLFINNVDCESIIKIHKTPIYCYSSSEILENYNNFHKSLRKLNFNDLSNVEEEIIFKEKIGRIRDIQVHPVSGKLYFLSENSLWLMEKN